MNDIHDKVEKLREECCRIWWTSISDICDKPQLFGHGQIGKRLKLVYDGIVIDFRWTMFGKPYYVVKLDNGKIIKIPADEH